MYIFTFLCLKLFFLINELIRCVSLIMYLLTYLINLFIYLIITLFIYLFTYYKTACAHFHFKTLFICIVMLKQVCSIIYAVSFILYTCSHYLLGVPLYISPLWPSIQLSCLYFELRLLITSLAFNTIVVNKAWVL